MPSAHRPSSSLGVENSSLQPLGWIQVAWVSQCRFFFFGWTLRHVGSEFPDQGSNLHPLHWKYGVLTTELPQNSQNQIFFFLQPYNICNFSSPARDRTCIPCFTGTEPHPLVHDWLGSVVATVTKNICHLVLHKITLLSPSLVNKAVTRCSRIVKKFQ